MINIGKKLANVTFQNPASSCIIFGNNPAEMPKTIDCPVCAFANPARIGIKNEFSVKIRV